MGFNPFTLMMNGLNGRLGDGYDLDHRADDLELMVDGWWLM